MDLKSHSALVIVLGGVSFFLLGMSLASEALQKLTANRTRDLLSKMSQSRMLSIFIGILLTIGMQSSGAVTSMLVSLGSAGVITLQQVMGLILGSAIGSTITVQLISFKIAQYGLPLFAIAFTAYFVANKTIVRRIYSILVGFGLIFFGLELISIGASIIQNYDFVRDTFVQLSEQPFLSLIVAMTFSAFVHSSAATIGVAMSLAASGLITYQDSIYWVLGANIGTTSTALMAASGGNFVGRQVAWAHFFFKVISVALFYFIATWFGQISQAISENSTRAIANAHTLYNIGATIMFFPLISIGAKVIEKLFPPRASEREFSTKYLEDDSYQSSALAIAHSRRELMRMGDIVRSMAEDSIELFKDDDFELESTIAERDNKVDLLHREIKFFLVKHLDSAGSNSSTEVFDLISFANDLESAADVIDNNLLELARKKHALKIDFSELGWGEVHELHDKVMKLTTISLTSFQTSDSSLAKEAISLKREIRKFESRLRESHIERLNQGLKESINTSSIHLDLLGEYKRFVGLMSNHAYQLVPKDE